MIIDDSLWPLRVVHFHGPLTASEFDEFLVRTAECYERRERYITVIDTSRGGMLSLEQRQRMAAFMRANDHHIRRYMLGSVFVITAPLVRLVLSTIFYLKPMPTAYVVTPSLMTAVDWASRSFLEAGLREQAERIRRHHGLPVFDGVDSESRCA